MDSEVIDSKLGGNSNLIAYSALLIAAIVVIMFVFYYFKKNMPEKNPIAPFYPFVKCLFVPSVGLYWWILSPSHPKIMYYYFLTATIGDAILLSSRFVCTIVGGAFFLSSHIIATVVFDADWKNAPILSYILLAPSATFHLFHFAPELMANGKRNIAAIVYLIVIEYSIACSAGRLSYLKFSDPSFLLCYIGYIFYAISDSILLSNRLNFNGRKNIDYECMSTYVVAQVAIATGMAICRKRV